MKTTKTVRNSKKALMAFAMLLFFVFSGAAKGLNFKLPATLGSKNNKAFGKQFLAATDDEAKSGSYSQPQGNDTDDADLLFFETPNFSFKPCFVPVAVKQTFAANATHIGVDNVPLYDLYCNWKSYIL